jgi:Double zinc ribbon
MNTFNEQFPAGPGTGTEATPRGFWGNLGLIQPVTWTIALILFFGMQALFWFVIWPQSHPDDLAKLGEAGRVCLPLLASSFLLVYVLLIGFIRVDAKRRGMRYVMWTLLAIFIPNAIGIILYFVLRDPLPTPCPKCSRLSAASFTFCPHCGAELMRTCRVCHKKLGPGWVNCAYCGTSLAGQAGTSAPRASA